MKNYEKKVLFDFNSQKFTEEDKQELDRIKDQVLKEMEKTNRELIRNGLIAVKFSYAKVPASLIRLDTENYQREATQYRVNKLTPYNPNLARGLAGIIKDDGVYLWDGGGRATAGVLAGYKEFWVAVYPNVKSEEAAELFSSQDNGKVRVARMLKLRALAFAGNDEALDIYNITREYGYSLQFPYESGAKQKNIKAITKLIDVYETYKKQGLIKMFNMYKEAGWEKYEEMTHTVFLSMGLYLNQILAYCNLHKDDLGLDSDEAYKNIIDAMKDITPGKFLDNAHAKCGDITCNMHRDEAAIRMYMKILAGVIS